jgi:hypothetical protein
MFTRIVKLTLKPNAGQEFTNTLETTIIPVLRKQPGFRDEMLLVKPGAPKSSRSVFGIPGRARRNTSALSSRK